MLWQRVVTAVVLALALGTVLFLLPPAGAVAALTLVAAAGAWEWARFARWQSPTARLGYVAALGLVMAVLWWLSGPGGALWAVLGATLAWWLFALGWMLFARTRVSRATAALAGLVVLGTAWLAFMRLYFAGERGPEFLLFAFVLVGAADVGAFFTGRRFGRVRLAPHISPGKTWEGVFGGFAMATVAAVAGAAWFGLPPAGFLPLCGAVVLASIVGDLAESMFKRAAGLKDSGCLLPGHGGVLDRIDSVCAGAPVLLLGLKWLGAIA